MMTKVDLSDPLLLITRKFEVMCLFELLLSGIKINFSCFEKCELYLDKIVNPKPTHHSHHRKSSQVHEMHMYL